MTRRFAFALLGFSTITAMVATACLIAAFVIADPDPPHAEPPAAEAPGTSTDPERAVLAHAYDAAAQAEIDRQVAAYLAAVEEQRIERERQEQEQRDAQARAAAPRARSGGSGSSDCATLAAQLGLPEPILWRESRCRWVDAPSNCDGWGCLGPAQVHAGHFAERSPWGGVGGCSDLDPADADQYADCVRRLSRDGADLSPWGG